MLELLKQYFLCCQKTIKIILLLVVAQGCGNSLNRIRESVWISMPYAVDKGMADSNRRFIFVTREKSYALIDSVLKIGFNAKYLIVLSYRAHRDSLEYWIVDKSVQEPDKIEKRENLEGPMDSAKFRDRKKILDLDSLKFIVDIK